MWITIAITSGTTVVVTLLVLALVYVVARRTGNLGSISFGKLHAEFRDSAENVSTTGELVLEIVREINRIYVESRAHRASIAKIVDKHLRYLREIYARAITDSFEEAGIDRAKLYQNAKYLYASERLHLLISDMKATVMGNFEANSFDELVTHAEEERYIEAAKEEIFQLVSQHIGGLSPVATAPISGDDILSAARSRRDRVSEITASLYREIIARSIRKKSELTSIVERLSTQLYHFGIQGTQFESISNSMKEEVVENVRRTR